MTDPEVLYARLTAAFREGLWTKAQTLALELLPFAPQHAGVYGIAGIASMELQHLSQAAEYLGRAVDLDPSRADFATLHAKALSMSGLTGQARSAADHALALSPTDPMILDTLGVIYTRAQAHERAAEVFLLAVKRSPDRASRRFNLATALVATGDVVTASLEFETCVRLDPEYWNAYLSLAQIRKQSAGGNHVQQLQSLLAMHQHDSKAQIYLNMALAKELEDIAEYPGAFAHLIRGKSAARISRHYSIRRDETLFAALTQAFQETSPAVAGHPTQEPIFVVGMPRSGTTLVERIVSNHPDVYAAGELTNFPLALQHAVNSRTPFPFDRNMVARMHRIDWQQLGADYLSSARPSTMREPHFIDKLPHNFLYIGFIAQALPNAKIICLRRDPLDTCLSNFRQLFSPESQYFDYSYDLLDTGRYYLLFDRLMAYWQKIFSGHILQISYEAVVNEQEASSRQLLDFCGLSWHDACLNFDSNQAPVSTFSAVQVRAPLYRSAIGRWERYKNELSELRALLIAGGAYSGTSTVTES